MKAIGAAAAAPGTFPEKRFTLHGKAAEVYVVRFGTALREGESLAKAMRTVGMLCIL